MIPVINIVIQEDVLIPTDNIQNISTFYYKSQIHQTKSRFVKNIICLMTWASLGFTPWWNTGQKP